MWTRLSFLPVLLVIGGCESLVGREIDPEAHALDVQPDSLLAALLERSPCDVIDIPGGISGDETPATPPAVEFPTDSGFAVMPGDSIVYEVDTDEPGADLVPDPIMVEALTDGDSWENEAHDCQRLILATADSIPDTMPTRTSTGIRLTYGPLVGLFPLMPAMERDQRWSAPQPVATVYNWGDWTFAPQPYTPLDVGDGWHCLWLRHDGRSWQGAIRPTHVPCADQPVPPLRHFNLLVTESVYAAGRRTQSDVYPHTVRWAWNAEQRTQYIGVKCGSAWCSVGVTAPPVPRQLQGDVYRVVPGWSDEQPLAIVGRVSPVPRPGVHPAPSGPNGLMPGPVGNIYPDSAFWNRSHPPFRWWNRFFSIDRDQIVREAFQRTGGLVVARIEVRGSAAMRGPYHRKFGMLAPASGAATSAIALQGAAPNFRAEFRGNGNHPTAVLYVPGAAHSSRGAVRWRWQEADEKVWVSCEDGCCTVQSL